MGTVDGNSAKILPLIDGLALLMNVLGEVFEDGKVDWADVASVSSLFTALNQLIHVDFNVVVPASKDLTEADKAIISKAFNEKFDIQDDSIENTIEDGLKYLLDGIKAVNFLRGLSK